MKIGLGLCAVGVAGFAVGNRGPCPDAAILVGMLIAPVGWLVSLVGLGRTAARAPRELIAPGMIALVLTTAIILLGNGSSWNVNEPESWITVALFFPVALTSAGVLLNRWRKGVAR